MLGCSWLSIRPVNYSILWCLKLETLKRTNTQDRFNQHSAAAPFMKSLIAAYCLMWNSLHIVFVCSITTFLLPALVLTRQLPARQARPLSSSSVRERERERKGFADSPGFCMNPGGMHSILLPALLLSKSPQARGNQTGTRPGLKRRLAVEKDLCQSYFPFFIPQILLQTWISVASAKEVVVVCLFVVGRITQTLTGWRTGNRPRENSLSSGEDPGIFFNYLL